MELDGISAPFVFDIGNVPVYLLRGLGFLPGFINGHHGTECTGKRAADAGMIGECFFPEVSPPQVFFHRV